jgi:hypothetical protein
MKNIMFFLLLLVLFCFYTSSYGQGVYVSDSIHRYAEKYDAKDISYLTPSKDGTELEMMMRDGTIFSLPKSSQTSLLFYRKDVTIEDFSVSNITDSSARFSIVFSGFNKSLRPLLVISTSHIDKSNLVNNIYELNKEDGVVAQDNLQPSTTYYAIGLIVNLLSNDSIFSNELSFTTSKATKGSINGYAYVDLGLPSGLLWATCDVGSSTEGLYGDFYAWGETSTQSKPILGDAYSWMSYAYSSGTSMKNIGSNISGTYYDVAHKRWGGTWRMPRKTEMEELVQYCTSEWTTINGHEGMKVTGPNGNYIFLPSAGRYSSYKSNEEASYCSFWSGTSCDLYHAYCLYIQKNPKKFMITENTSLNMAGNERCNGYCVRPVSE